MNPQSRRMLVTMVATAGAFLLGVAARDASIATGAAQDAVQGAGPAASKKANKPKPVILFRKNHFIRLILEREPTEPNYPAKADIKSVRVRFRKGGPPQDWTVIAYNTSGKKLALVLYTGTIRVPDIDLGAMPAQEPEEPQPSTAPAPAPGPGDVVIVIDYEEDGNPETQEDTVPGSEVDYDPCMP